jgi:hypothetical protein
MSGGLAALLFTGFVGVLSRSSLPMLSAFGIWLPLVPVEVIVAIVGVKMILVSGAASVGAAFAATEPSTPEAPPSCRLCGAPLTVNEGDILARCIYCKADSIVYLDQPAISDLQRRVGLARSSLAQAMAALAAKARIIRLQVRGRAAVIAAFLILPLIWSFSADVQRSYWSTLIALDVWLLAICLFWYVREAFLPPATIEELEAMIDGPVKSRNDQSQPKAAVPDRTRGWYDHAYDKRNFVIPAVVALMFLATELWVLNR